MSDHISDLRWDRLLAGDLSSPDADDARTHAAACASCGVRLRELTAERDAFKLRPVGFGLTKPVRRVRWWWTAPIAALAAAAVAIVFVREPPLEGERTKGRGVKLSLSAGPPGQLAALASGDAIHPGDYVQAGYTAARHGFGAVLSLDGAGTAMAYVPPKPDAMVALPAGADRSYPGSTVLDATTGTELIAIVWCDRTRPIQPLLEELRTTRELTAPSGCELRLITLTKRAAP